MRQFLPLVIPTPRLLGHVPEDGVAGRYKNPLVALNYSLLAIPFTLRNIPTLLVHNIHPCLQILVSSTCIYNYVFLHLAFADYILMLNNYLQSTGEAHLLSWEFGQSGPEHQATHTAVAKRVSTSSPVG